MLLLNLIMFTLHFGAVKVSKSNRTLLLNANVSDHNNRPDDVWVVLESVPAGGKPPGSSRSHCTTFLLAEAATADHHTDGSTARMRTNMQIPHGFGSISEH